MMDIRVNEDGSTTVALSYPISHDGKTIDEVTVRRPKVRDLKRIDGKEDMAQTVMLIEILTGLSRALVDDMDTHDFKVIGDIIGGYTSKGKSGSALGELSLPT